MAEVTSTRKELRREIARSARMEFFRRYSGDELILATDSSVSSLHCTDLTQANDFWNNGFAYISSTGAAGGQERMITDFSSTGDTLSLEYPLTTAPVAGEMLEIHEIWPPSKIHQAINDAIDIASRLFTDTVVDKTTVICEDKLRYSLTGLTKRVARINHVWIERTSNELLGSITTIATSAPNYIITNTSLFDTNDEYNTYKIAFYSGTGAGGIATIDDTSSAGTITFTSADVTTAPVADDKFRIWNENYQVIDLYEIRNFRVDAPEYPDTLALERLFPEHYGCRMWIEYTSFPTALTTDASTTIIPKEYIRRKALALLYDDKIADSRADTQRYQNLAQYFHSQADEYLMRYYPQRPSSTIPIQPNPGLSNELSDPLDWHS